MLMELPESAAHVATDPKRVYYLGAGGNPCHAPGAPLIFLTRPCLRPYPSFRLAHNTLDGPRQGLVRTVGTAPDVQRGLLPLLEGPLERLLECRAMLLNVTGLKSKHVTTPARIVLRLYTGLLEHLRCVVTLRECQPKPEPLLSRLEHDEVVGFAIACETDEVLVVLGLKLVIDPCRPPVF